MRRQPLSQERPPAHVLSDLWQDLRYAARMMRKQPAFTLAAVLTLALGLGANAAMFSVINAVLLRPLPFPDSERLVAIYSRYLPSSGYDFPFFNLSPPEFADVRNRIDAFVHTAAYRFNERNLTRGNGEAERVLTMSVTAEFFDVLGVKPARGRIFTNEEAQDGEQQCLAVLRHDASATTANAIGSTIRLDDAPCEVGEVSRSLRQRALCHRSAASRRYCRRSARRAAPPRRSGSLRAADCLRQSWTAAGERAADVGGRFDSPRWGPASARSSG
jgi:MacB-like periplasmic core domain